MDAALGLEIESLSKTFGHLRALDDLSFEVAPGEIFGFVGANGAGKTTTMRIVLGVMDADAGEVRWRGQPIDQAARRRIGYMPEDRGLYPRMKVGEQLTYLARLHGLTSAAAATAAKTWAERLGVGGRLGDEVQKLSRGNQQRVQLAAALVHQPEVLVLDEPFSGLDPLAVDVMSGVLAEKAAEGIPVIFSSHQLELVERLCDAVGIIMGGRMVAKGSVDALRARAPRRLVVETPGRDASWVRGLDGVELIESSEGRTVLELEATGDDQEVLHAALAGGSVAEFAAVRPGLAELYRDAVQQAGEAP